MAPTGEPTDGEILDHLDAICATETFRRATRCRNFLRYVVEETLAGRTDRIKAYAIAVSVLGRDESFDPQADPVVRIEAGHLRRRLEHYYLTDGSACTVRIELQPFTLVGATTRLGLLTTPLRDRFGIPTRLEFYTVAELDLIVQRGARLMGIDAEPDGTQEIARRARGTPRIAGRLLRRVVDFALVEGDGRLTRGIADTALTRLGVDDMGLDGADRRYLLQMAEHYGGGPVGVETLSAALSESRDAIEEVIEPYLLQQGLIARTPRGRQLTSGAWRHLGLAAPAPAQQGTLFDG